MMMNPKLTNFLVDLDVLNFSDSHDVSALAALPDLERQVAHNALIARARHGDARAIISVGHLGLAEAVPYLRLLTTHPSRWVRFSVHRALAMLGFAEGVRPLIDDASHGIMIERFAAPCTSDPKRHRDIFNRAEFWQQMMKLIHKTNVRAAGKGARLIIRMGNILPCQHHSTACRIRQQTRTLQQGGFACAGCFVPDDLI